MGGNYVARCSSTATTNVSSASTNSLMRCEIAEPFDGDITDASESDAVTSTGKKEKGQSDHCEKFVPNGNQRDRAIILEHMGITLLENSDNRR